MNDSGQDTIFLRVKNLESGYGKKLILDGISFSVSKGEIVAIVGHNGAGKSTLLKVIFGILPAWKGDIFFNGNNIDGKREMAFVPQGNRIFDELTVKENLLISGYTIKDKNVYREKLTSVFLLFPKLKDRFDQNAGTLSGGEQQILSLGMALILNPRLLLLDEPSLGLSPPLVRVAFKKIEQINRELGTTIIIVEQKIKEALKISKKVVVLKIGKVSFEGSPQDLLEGDRIKKVFF